jgi:IclR family transcriptional regulator, acetate operon repressor
MTYHTSHYPGAQAVARAIAVLKTFTDDHPQMTLADITCATRLNRATAYRLVSALEKEGLVARDKESEAYHLGPEAIALGARALRANDLRSVCHPELEALAQATGETATLEVLADGGVLILDEVQGHHIVGSTPSIGTRWPAHATSTGKVLLAHLPEAALPHSLPQFTHKTITKPDALRRELARIRERGHATNVAEFEAGYNAVSAPVRNHAGTVVAAVGVGGPDARLTPGRMEEIAGMVREAADRISHRLGCKETNKKG